MISGVPAIVSDRVGCAHDLVINDETGFVFKFGDIEQMADRMIRLAEEPARRRDMGKRARDHVLSKFSVAAAVENTMRVIRSYRPTSALE
jgi:glycosyltransferase involved in cell wall biosynthesis